MQAFTLKITLDTHSSSRDYVSALRVAAAGHKQHPRRRQVVSYEVDGSGLASMKSIRSVPVADARRVTCGEPLIRALTLAVDTLSRLPPPARGEVFALFPSNCCLVWACWSSGTVL